MCFLFGKEKRTDTIAVSVLFLIYNLEGEEWKKSTYYVNSKFFITYGFIIDDKCVRGMSEMKKKYEQICSYLHKVKKI